MNIEFIVGKRYILWRELGWQTSDEDGIPLGISINLSAIYAGFGFAERNFIKEIIYVIEHEVLHYTIHLIEPFIYSDQEEVVNMLQVTSSGLFLPNDSLRYSEDDDYLVGYV